MQLAGALSCLLHATQRILCLVWLRDRSTIRLSVRMSVCAPYVRCTHQQSRAPQAIQSSSFETVMYLSQGPMTVPGPVSAGAERERGGGGELAASPIYHIGGGLI